MMDEDSIQAHEVEPCAGCGVMDEEDHPHPMVGIGKDEDGNFAAFGVCLQCHREPAKRKFPLKMHFFNRDQRVRALAAAGSDNIGGG